MQPELGYWHPWGEYGRRSQVVQGMLDLEVFRTAAAANQEMEMGCTP